MADLRTRYMGIELKNPIVVGACSLSKQIDTIRQIEAAGAGALVIKSLFEEQVQLERHELEESLTQFDELYAEAIKLFPDVDHSGPKQHLHWVAETKKAVSLPLIGSLNALNPKVWVDYARQLADTGVDGLELNFYSLPLDAAMSSAEVEKHELEAFAKVREAVKLPIAVKLHPHYTSLMHMASELDKLGADAVVLFNRLFQPDVDVNSEQEKIALQLSSPAESLVPLRWTALLYGRIKADIISSTGISTGKDVARMLLAGASAVQVVSAVYRNKVTHIGRMLEELEDWMGAKGYQNLEAFRGKASKKNVKDPWAYERGQYIKALLGFD